MRTMNFNRNENIAYIDIEFLPFYETGKTFQNDKKTLEYNKKVFFFLELEILLVLKKSVAIYIETTQLQGSNSCFELQI